MGCRTGDRRAWRYRLGLLADADFARTRGPAAEALAVLEDDVRRLAASDRYVRPRPAPGPVDRVLLRPNVTTARLLLRRPFDSSTTLAQQAGTGHGRFVSAAPRSGFPALLIRWTLRDGVRANLVPGDVAAPVDDSGTVPVKQAILPHAQTRSNRLVALRHRCSPGHTRRPVRAVHRRTARAWGRRPPPRGAWAVTNHGAHVAHGHTRTDAVYVHTATGTRHCLGRSGAAAVRLCVQHPGAFPALTPGPCGVRLSCNPRAGLAEMPCAWSSNVRFAVPTSASSVISSTASGLAFAIVLDPPVCATVEVAAALLAAGGFDGAWTGPVLSRLRCMSY